MLWGAKALTNILLLRQIFLILTPFLAHVCMHEIQELSKNAIIGWIGFQYIVSKQQAQAALNKLPPRYRYELEVNSLIKTIFKSYIHLEIIFTP